MERIISPERIQQTVQNRIPNWGFLDGALRLDLSFDSNQETVLMLNQLTVLAEKNKHHPDLTINQLNVSVSIFTHDVNGITEKDFVLAEEINNLLKNKVWNGI